MTRKQFFFLEGAYMGEALRDRHFVHTSSEYPRGYGFFCPTCCRVWATAPTESVSSIALHMACLKCPPWLAGTPPGSLWVSLDEGFNEALPDSLLRRELDIHLKFYTRSSL